jgi:radical SAM protein with 4Fe4S-binding SPASM domain
VVGEEVGLDLDGGVKICRMVSEAKSFGFGESDEGKYVQLQQKRKVEKKSARATESCSECKWMGA